MPGRVPENAKIVKSPEHRWWRSDSPVREGEMPEHPGHPPNNYSEGADTRGALGQGKRTGPVCYQSSYQTGSGTAAHFKNDAADVPFVSGYSGHIPGKYAGNVIGGTFIADKKEAEEHLKTTLQ